MMPTRSRATSVKKGAKADARRVAADEEVTGVELDTPAAVQPPVSAAAATHTSTGTAGSGKGKRRGRSAAASDATAPQEKSTTAAPAASTVAPPAAAPPAAERSEADIRAAGLSLVARMYASASSASSQLLRSATSASSSPGVDASHPVLLAAARGIAHDKLTTRALGASVSKRPHSSALPSTLTGGMIRYAHEDGAALPMLNHVRGDLPQPLQAAADKAVKGSAATGVAADGAAVAPRVFSAITKRVRPEDRTALGGKWFNMTAHTLTAEVKKDLLVLRNRAYMDPKRHYKTREEREGPLPRFFDIGTVQEAPQEVFSQRLTKKERAPTLVDALLADEKFRQYAKKHATAMREKGVSGTKNALKRQRESSAPAWKREMNMLDASRPRKKKR